MLIPPQVRDERIEVGPDHDVEVCQDRILASEDRCEALAIDVTDIALQLVIPGIVIARGIEHADMRDEAKAHERGQVIGQIEEERLRIDVIVGVIDVGHGGIRDPGVPGLAELIDVLPGELEAREVRRDDRADVVAVHLGAGIADDRGLTREELAWIARRKEKPHGHVIKCIEQAKLDVLGGREVDPGGVDIAVVVITGVGDGIPDD